MKYLYLAILLFCCSCQSLRVATNKTPANTPSIGIHWEVAGRINEKLQPRLDSIINKEMADFNAEKHSFTVHKKLPKEKDYLTIELKRGKIAGKGERAAGYIVTTVGLVATPAYLVAADLGFIAAFYYWPTNRIEHRMQLSSGLSESDHYKSMIADTGALFANNQKQVDKLLVKFAQQLHLQLIAIEKQLAAN